MGTLLGGVGWLLGAAIVSLSVTGIVLLVIWLARRGRRAAAESAPPAGEGESNDR